MSHILVWDLETVPDLEAVRRIHGKVGCTDAEATELLGDQFPKLPLHKIVCIGALLAERTPDGLNIVALGAPHIGERGEAQLISDFASKIEQVRPQLIAFNGHGFDLPVIRYRAMVNYVSAPGLICRNYFNRYSDDCLDLCDALASFDGLGKLKLD
jgi:predicted PolB exonuclease-like 3'-5' exonuclease